MIRRADDLIQERAPGVPQFHRVIGKKTEALDPVWLDAVAARHARTGLDVGTGDGRFVLARARAEPDCLWIGIDAVAEAMAGSARTAGAKPAKGGLANALFLRAAAEDLPGPLAGKASNLSVNYPWGSLLRIVALPDVVGLRRLAAAARPGATVSILLNHSVFEDPDYLERLGLAGLSDIAVNETLPAGYRAAGFGPVSRAVTTADPAIGTRWAGQLVRGANRSTLVIETSIPA